MASIIPVLAAQFEQRQQIGFQEGLFKEISFIL
jgi:hypothetical protein